MDECNPFESELFVTATPIGNLEDLSPRAVRILRSCEMILAEDTRHTQKLMNHYEISTKLISYHAHNERERSMSVIRTMSQRPIHVALVSDAGTPAVCDPGSFIVEAAHEAGIRVTAIPGCSALSAALSVSGFHTTPVAFYGFLPKEEKKVDTWIRTLEHNEAGIAVFFESPKRIVRTLKALAAVMPNALACVCSDLTKRYENVMRDTVQALLDKMSDDRYVQKGEYTVILHLSDEVKKPKMIDRPTIQARLFEQMIRNDLSLKEAVKAVAKSDDAPTKNQVYRESLELKTWLDTYAKRNGYEKDG